MPRKQPRRNNFLAKIPSFMQYFLMQQQFNECSFPWQDLTVLKFIAGKESISSTVRSWQQNRIFAPMETCTRQIWAGVAGTFQDFPERDNKRDFHFVFGQKAYAYLLEVFTGLHSPRVGEDHITHQYREKWERFRTIAPTFEAFMRPLKIALDEDNAVVRRDIIDHLIPPEDVHAARILSGQQKGDRILIIGHIGKDGLPYKDTQKFIKFFANNRNGRPLADEIELMGSTEDESRKMLDWVLGLKKNPPSDRAGRKKKLIHDKIVWGTIPQGSLDQAVQTYDRVYMTSPMNRVPQMDHALITAWQQRERRDNCLVCVRGASVPEGRSPEYWVNAGLDHFVRPEDLRKTSENVGAYNRQVVDVAEFTIEECAIARVQNTRLRTSSYTELIDHNLRPKPVC
jgi:hypothetical protein